MNKEIIIEVKKSYGVERIYPVSREAIIFAAIAETTTLTIKKVKLIQELGYKIIEKEELGEKNCHVAGDNK